MLPEDAPHPMQIEIYRKMTADQRLQIAHDLYWFAREWKASALRAQHPTWGEEKIQEKVREMFLNATT
jgi:hypothetical protein